MNRPTEGPHTPDRLSNRKAIGLLIAFLAVVVIFVLAQATMPVPSERASTDEPMDNSQSRLVDRRSFE